MPDSDRRKFPRVHAPIWCRPAGLAIFGPPRQTRDVSEGGLRIYSDIRLDPPQRLEIELFLPDQSSVVAQVEVVWIDALAAGSPAAYDVGLRFIEVSAEDFQRLSSVLEGQQREP